MRPILLILPLALTLTLPGQETPLPSSAVAPPAPPSAGAAKVPRGRITGTVFCGDTHAPARGASVLLSGVPGKQNPNPGPLGQKVTHVSVNGTYAFEHVPAGDYTVIALFQGYLSVFDDLPPNMLDGDAQEAMLKIFTARGITSVTADGSATSDIVLERGAAISGRVLYADGSPAGQLSVIPQDAKVSDKPSLKTVPFDPMVMMKSMFTRSSYTTDDLGRFRLNGLKPGVYRVVVTQPSNSGGSFNDDGMAMFSGLIGDPGGFHFYSGDTWHQKAAKTFTVSAGDELTGVDIRLPIDGFHAVSGYLTAVDGRPVNLGRLTLTDTTDDSFVFTVPVDPDGTFRFPAVPPGTYTLASSDAQIGTSPPPGTSPAFNYEGPLTPTNAFADASAPVIVKESDLSGVSLTLTEIPLVKNPGAPTPTPDANE